MWSVNEKKHLMKRHVRIQVERDGVTGAARGVLTRSTKHSDRRIRWREILVHLQEEAWSMVAFLCGLLLASLYGVAALFLQKQPLWFCAYSTVIVAALAAYSLGLSHDVRVDIMVMLPTLCSARGRKFLLFLFASLLLSGPLTNTLENMERAAASLLCGAELAANQTQELMHRSATPLFSALDRIREISRNAHAFAGRVQNFIHALTDSVRHVARTLRNVLHFLVDIGDVCNAKLGSPYRKCRAVFADAKADCSDLLGEHDFLCDIIDGFLPLCSLARAGELFCTIPSYIANHLKKRLAAPVVAAFDQLKREFDFNLTASVKFDLDANLSRSLQQMSQDIMEEVSSELHLLQKLKTPLIYSSLVLLVLSYLRAMRYRQRYLSELDFDNIYISAQFEELDHQLTSEGGSSVLPITSREAATYITPLSLHLTAGEWRAALLAVTSVLRHMVMGGLLVALDFLVFWVLDQVQQQVKGDVVARAPVTVAVHVNGSGYASDIFRDLVASFNILQGGNITVISKKCFQELSEPDYHTCFTLGLLLGLCLLMSVCGGLMKRCRRLICASCYPQREQERIRFLRQQILDQRRMVGRALRSATQRGHHEEQGGRAGGRLRALLLRVPGGAYLSHLLCHPSVTCLSCGEEVRQNEDSMVACDVPQCPGVFCRPCFHSLGNTCVFCVRPLAFQEDGEEELDSSDDEEVSLTHVTDRRVRRRTVSTASHQRPAECPKEPVSFGNADSEGGALSDSVLSEADMTYQETPGSDNSDASIASTQTRLQDETLQTVIVHT